MLNITFEDIHIKILKAHAIKGTFCYNTLTTFKSYYGLSRDDDTYSKLLENGWLEAGRDTKGRYIVTTSKGRAIIDVYAKIEKYKEQDISVIKSKGDTFEVVTKEAALVEDGLLIKKAKYNF